MLKELYFGQNELENYLEKMASGHTLSSNASKNTYPMPRLKENFEIITQVYETLNEHVKLKIPIHPAGEWILDNYYIIDETIKAIKSNLTIKKYTNFLGIANGVSSGFARIYTLAGEIISYTDNKIDAKSLEQCLEAYQRRKKLNMEEIWNIPMFLQISIIENIREICEKIYSSQMQKYRVENIIERLVENKNKEELQFTHLSQYKQKVKGYGQMKYPFIEYLSYRLKQYGKKAYPYLNILEEQVAKMGMEVSEVVKKQHFDIAICKISMGNAITSLKKLTRINMIEIFENINGVEDILKQDPAGVYENMDHETKKLYRNKIKQISQKTKISEIYIVKKIWNLANQAKQPKQRHVGYYLIAQGENQLWQELILRKPRKNMKPKNKIALAITGLSLLSLLIAALFSYLLYYQINSVLLCLVLAILLLVPISTIIVQIAQYILGKIIKPKPIPKIDLRHGIPQEAATFVVIPTIINSKEKLQKLMKSLEVYYIANQSDNLYLALLGDVTSGKCEKEPFDQEIIQEGIALTQKLNEKYQDLTFPKFHFLYRKRIWNEKENCYLGWERKRGLLNQFNDYILGKTKNEFLANTIETVKQTMPKIKYIITLDADTKLNVNTGLELIGAMQHILNTPVLNKQKDCVIEGHGLIQPRVGISLEEVEKSTFTKLYAGAGGKDAYTNAISDLYQDNFEEGIFTGKGIYNLPIFSEVLSKEIPENTVLSHDLLEGSYLRCGLASDIMLMDGYPVGYNSHKARLHRWIRGDWQVSKWLKRTITTKDGQKKHNPLNLLSKYKIFDNLVRSLQEAMIMLSFLYINILNLFYPIKIGLFILLLAISAIIPSMLEILNRILFKKEQETIQKTFNKTITGIKASFIRAILSIGTLPDKAYFSLDAALKTIYRMKISKKHLLEWVTAEDAEKNAKNDLKSYYKNMFANVIIALFSFFLVAILPYSWYSIFLMILAILWLITPSIVYYISKPIKKQNKLNELNEKEKQYLLEIGKKTWKYFKDFLTPTTNFLPPDNYQEDRKPKTINRTSPTNIGLSLLAVISSYDLGYENLQNTLNLLEKMLNTVMNMPKWNGHLYNWYELENLVPLNPRYVSSVDSGNLVGYLFTTKQFLEEQKNKTDQINNLITVIDTLINQTDFSKLYDKQNSLFSIGFNVEENQLTNCYYDLLASEARQTSFIAIAKKDVPVKHWNNLSRTLTILNKYKGLISWSGTAFEYLMPNSNMPTYPGSLLAESSKFMIMSQKEYAKKLNLPWGISESAFNLKDLNNNYQYKAFGIPWLGLKRGLRR